MAIDVKLIEYSVSSKQSRYFRSAKPSTFAMTLYTVSHVPEAFPLDTLFKKKIQNINRLGFGCLLTHVILNPSIFNL